LSKMMTTMIEELSMRAWPAFETENYDGWVLRFAEGYTKRSNSIQSLYPSTIAPAEKITYCEKAYAGRGLPAIFKLTEESTPAGLDGVLEKRGYRKLDETSVRMLALHGEYDTRQAAGYYTHLKEEWLSGYARCSRIDHAETVQKRRKILSLIAEETIFAYIKMENAIVACGLGVIGGGYLGCFDIVVDAGHRKKGYGRRIMEGLLAEGAKRGAKNAYLQVVAGNTPAEMLYDSLGFTEVYRYWYRRRQ
jgi:GNAT superfamily N-acetyltransferase